MTVTSYAPASIGNLNVGFDLLGAAIAPIDGQLLGDRVRVEGAPAGISLVTIGRYADRLPLKPQDNIVYQCAEFFINHLGQQVGLKITLEKNLPIGSGLGSSASSVVAALSALNDYFATPFSDYELIKLMGIFEGRISGAIHYDNVAPSFFGGMQLMVNGNQAVSASIPYFSHWYWLVAYSGEQLATAKMRQLLPSHYERQTTLAFGQNLAAFVHASYQQDAKLAASMLVDLLAEPYRASSISGFQTAKQALAAMSVLATGISGSGPTLFCVTDQLELAKQAKSYLEQHYIDAETGFVHICQIDPQGVRHRE